MKSNSYAALAGLPAEPEPPCLTVYQPTARGFPDRQQNPIRFKNLVRTLEASLAASSPAAVRRALLEPFRALEQDDEFWLEAQGGLAAFGARDFFRVMRLPRQVPELAVVAPSFHVKPLLRQLQSADRYQILGLTLDAIRLFEGNRDAIEEIAPAEGVPRTLIEALGSELTEPHLTVASYGRGAAGPAMHHGHHSRRDEVEVDADRVSRLPLVLAALPEHQGRVRALSRNPHLVEQGVAANPAALSPDELCDRAWEAMEPHYLARLTGLIERYQAGVPKQLATDDLERAAEAAVARRIETLLVDADRRRPGRIDAVSGQFSPGSISAPEIDDALDDLAEMVLHAGGDVVVVPSPRMPTEAGCAAILRF
jgi:hypothetical protein